MFKDTMEYTKDTLFISVEGVVNKNHIRELKRKLYSILNEYSIEDIIIDLSNIHEMDQDAFYDFLDDYDIKYGGNLVVTENQK